MPWRRCLWFGLLLALGWGLWLFVPLSPRWTLPEPEVVIRANGTRLLTFAVNAPTEDELAELQALSRPFAGPVDTVGEFRLRNLQSGRLLGRHSFFEPIWRLDEVSADLRFVFCSTIDKAERRLLYVCDLEADTQWTKLDIKSADPTPRGTLVHVSFANHDELCDIVSGRILAIFPKCNWPEVSVAKDDSWAFLAVRDNEQDKKLSARWTLWCRDGNRTTQGTFPTPLEQIWVSPDFCMAVLLPSAPGATEKSIQLWDVAAGKVVKEVNAPIQTYRNVEVDFVATDNALVISYDQSESAFMILDLASGATGKIHGPPQTLVYRFTLSPDGRCAVYPQSETARWRGYGSVIAVTYPEMNELWRFRSEKDSARIVKWLPEKNRLLAQYQYPQDIRYATHGAVILDGNTGRPLFSRDDGFLSNDDQALLHWRRSQNNDANDLFSKFLRWLPWFKRDRSATLTVERLEDGAKVFHRIWPYSKTENAPRVDWHYLDKDTLVISNRGHSTEIWDLPPGKPWLWILGPPLVLAVLPLLFRRCRRKQSGPAASSGIAATAAPAPASG